MYYYTYLLTNRITGMKYIGKRTSKILPILDTSYMGSSKHVPIAECDKTILSEFSNHLDLVNEEIRLHNLFDVAKNAEFYNRAKQTSTKFDTTGVKFIRSEEYKIRISNATTGVKKTLTPEQRQTNKQRLATYHTPEIRAKAAAALRNNKSNKGIKNSSFSPWYISTATVTYLFLDISKIEKALYDGFAKKHYVDLQRKLSNPHKHKLYGQITAIGNLPKQYKI